MPSPPSPPPQGAHRQPQHPDTSSSSSPRLQIPTTAQSSHARSTRGKGETTDPPDLTPVSSAGSPMSSVDSPVQAPSVIKGGQSSLQGQQPQHQQQSTQQQSRQLPQPQSQPQAKQKTSHPSQIGYRTESSAKVGPGGGGREELSPGPSAQPGVPSGGDASATTGAAAAGPASEQPAPPPPLPETNKKITLGPEMDVMEYSYPPRPPPPQIKLYTMPDGTLRFEDECDNCASRRRICTGTKGAKRCELCSRGKRACMRNGITAQQFDVIHDAGPWPWPVRTPPLPVHRPGAAGKASTTAQRASTPSTTTPSGPSNQPNPSTSTSAPTTSSALVPTPQVSPNRNAGDHHGHPHQQHYAHHQHRGGPAASSLPVLPSGGGGPGTGTLAGTRISRYGDWSSSAGDVGTSSSSSLAQHQLGTPVVVGPGVGGVNGKRRREEDEEEDDELDREGEEGNEMDVTPASGPGSGAGAGVGAGGLGAKRYPPGRSRRHSRAVSDVSPNTSPGSVKKKARNDTTRNVSSPGGSGGYRASPDGLQRVSTPVSNPYPPSAAAPGATSTPTAAAGGGAGAIPPPLGRSSTPNHSHPHGGQYTVPYYPDPRSAGGIGIGPGSGLNGPGGPGPGPGPGPTAGMGGGATSGPQLVFESYFKIDRGFDTTDHAMQAMLRDLRQIQNVCRQQRYEHQQQQQGGEQGTRMGMGMVGELPCVNRTVEALERMVEELRGLKGVKDELRMLL